MVLALGVISMLSLIVAGATSLVSFAERIHPVAGTIVFWGICLAAGFFALYCLIAYAQLPPALVPPKETSGPKLAYRIGMGVRSADQNWKRLLNRLIAENQGAINRILLDFGVPLLDENDRSITAETAAKQP